MKLTLVAPCYNEQDNIVDFCRECVRVFNKAEIDFDFVFVNDGSKDNTLNTLREVYSLGKLKMTIVNFSRNFGKEAAIFAGLKHSTGDIVTVIDADLQQRPEVVVEMLAYLKEHEDCDCVAAYQEERHEPSLLKKFKGAFYGLINQISTTQLYPGASDFRTMRRPMVDAVINMTEYHRFSKGIFSWVGFNTHYMPYIARERNAGDSKWSFKKLFEYAIEGIVAFTVKPLRIPIYLSAVSFIGSLIYFIFLIIKLCIGTYTTAHLAVFFILLLGSCVLLSLGILCEYSSKTYMQSKNRPVFIEKNVWSTEENK